MKELAIEAHHLEIFRTIVNTCRKSTNFPKRNQWKSLTNSELWFWVVGQVMVVGSSAGNDRFLNREDLKQKIDFSNLYNFQTDKEVHRAIHDVLRASGVRYASSQIEKCQKSIALLHNFKFFRNYNNGIQGVLQELSRLTGPTAEKERAKFLRKHLKFMKNKGSRDFLMSMGINRNTLAIDVRIQNIFKYVGIQLPTSNELFRCNVYDAVERKIIQKICMPLKIEPVCFDRILYMNYDEITKIVKLKLKEHGMVDQSLLT